MTQTETRAPRLANTASSPDAVAGVQQIIKAIYAGGVPPQTLELVHMRVSQINGCNACIAAGINSAEKAGLGTERLLSLPAWRESDLYDQAERAAVQLAEAMTRLADHPDVVTDEIWAEAVDHFDDRALSALVSMIALTNFFNRVNTTLRVQPGAWG
jgi:AhpD family alkylhydroperoxidase